MAMPAWSKAGTACSGMVQSYFIQSTACLIHGAKKFWSPRSVGVRGKAWNSACSGYLPCCTFPGWAERPFVSMRRRILRAHENLLSHASERIAWASLTVRSSHPRMHFSNSSRPASRVAKTRSESLDKRWCGKWTSSTSCDQAILSLCFFERMCIRLKGFSPLQRVHCPTNHFLFLVAPKARVSVSFLLPGIQRLVTIPNDTSIGNCCASNTADGDMCDGCGMYDGAVKSSGAIGCCHGAFQTSSVLNAPGKPPNGPMKGSATSRMCRGGMSAKISWGAGYSKYLSHLSEVNSGGDKFDTGMSQPASSASDSRMIDGVLRSHGATSVGRGPLCLLCDLARSLSCTESLSSGWFLSSCLLAAPVSLAVSACRSRLCLRKAFLCWMKSSVKVGIPLTVSMTVGAPAGPLALSRHL